MLPRQYGPEPGPTGSEAGGGNAALLQSAITEADAFTTSVDEAIKRIVDAVGVAVADAVKKIEDAQPDDILIMGDPALDGEEMPVDEVPPINDAPGEDEGSDKGTSNSLIGPLPQPASPYGRLSNQNFTTWKMERVEVDLMAEIDQIRGEIDAFKPEVDTLKLDLVGAKNTANAAYSIALTAKQSANDALAKANSIECPKSEPSSDPLNRPAEHNNNTYSRD